MLCLPGGPGRTMRLILFRGPGPDFTERDRALLTLLRPHLREAYLDAERRRRGVPDLTPRHAHGEHLRAAAGVQPHRLFLATPEASLTAILGS
jgi:hypothetical protein